MEFCGVVLAVCCGRWRLSNLSMGSGESQDWIGDRVLR